MAAKSFVPANERTYFDDLIEGTMHAVRDQKGMVMLYVNRSNISEVIAVFYSEAAFSLVHGHATVELFNDTMAKRRGVQEAIHKES